MQITKYGITLQNLEAADLEMVRGWRNADHVRPYMQYREFITPQMQSEWFRSLSPSENLYLIIKKDGTALGVVNLKDINYATGTAEAGIFIGLTEYLSSMVPFLATISLMEYAFDTLKLKSLKAKISRTNTKVILFNQSIGYKRSSQQGDELFDYYTVDHADFLAVTEKLRGTLDKLNRTQRTSF